MDGVDLSGLFPDGGVFVQAFWFDAEPAPLLPAEQLHVERAVAQRRREFAAGRDCARRCFALAGLSTDLPLLPDRDRAPVWPSGWTGAITHTLVDGRLFAAAVLANTSRCLAVGIDAEPGLPVSPDIASTVLTAIEAERLTRRAAGDADSMGVLTRAVFSAKETLYKAQPTASRRMAGFDEVDIDFQDGLPEQDRPPHAFRYTRWDGFRGTGYVFRPAGLLITGLQITPVPPPPTSVDPW